MSASKTAKQHGLRGTVEVMEITGMGRRTLEEWSTNRPKLFKVVVVGAAAIKKENIDIDAVTGTAVGEY